jgi:hypothetical protein
LYLIEYADWHYNALIGTGYHEESTQSMVMGATDSMPYHTGTMGKERSESAGT